MFLTNSGQETYIDHNMQVNKLYKDIPRSAGMVHILNKRKTKLNAQALIRSSYIQQPSLVSKLIVKKNLHFRYD